MRPGTLAADLVDGELPHHSEHHGVDDAEAPETMVRLHSFITKGADPADALRRTARLDRAEGKPVPLSVRLLVMGGSRLLVR